jgi:hypothetical protein
MKTLAPLVALVLMIFPADWAKAQTDATADSASLTGSSVAEPRQSASLALFAGVQRGIQTGEDQQTQDIRMLVGVAPNIPLGGVWELSPEASMWRLMVYYKEQWNLRVGLPLRWFALVPGRFSAYVLTGPAILFAGGAILTLDVGGGICWTATPAFTLTSEVRTYLYYHTSEMHSSRVLASPVSLIVGVRLTPAD